MITFNRDTFAYNVIALIVLIIVGALLLSQVLGCADPGYTLEMKQGGKTTRQTFTSLEDLEVTVYNNREGSWKRANFRYLIPSTTQPTHQVEIPLAASDRLDGVQRFQLKVFAQDGTDLAHLPFGEVVRGGKIIAYDNLSGGEWEMDLNPILNYLLFKANRYQMSKR